VLDQVTITDDTGKVILKAAQQDSVILRVVARYGFRSRRARHAPRCRERNGVPVRCPAAERRHDAELAHDEGGVAVAELRHEDGPATIAPGGQSFVRTTSAR
jgi:hypothetical protein